ncbi:MAG: hypothetical protein J5817_10345, partial [Treponema sp.]|nr:hypothetical protein [Treponema sp.]
KFIVFYNGSENEAGRWSMKLSDAFIREDKSGCFEWTADVINMNPNRLSLLQKKCKPLYDYIRYVYRIKQSLKSGSGKVEAVDEAVKWAIKEKLLDGFFKKQKAEVTGMSLTEFDEEEFKRVCREDGYEDGLEDGKARQAIESAENLLKEGLPPEQIARCIGLPLEKVQELADSVCEKA